MSVATLQKVLRDARRLPLNSQTELAETLLREANSSLTKPKIRNTSKSPLEILSGMSVDELETLADAVLAPGRQRRLHNLLRKNQVRELSENEEKELNGILEEVDRIALLKAKAMYTLSVFKKKDGK
jgi:hypothetical protein